MASWDDITRSEASSGPSFNSVDPTVLSNWGPNDGLVIDSGTGNKALNGPTDVSDISQISINASTGLTLDLSGVSGAVVMVVEITNGSGYTLSVRQGGSEVTGAYSGFVGSGGWSVDVDSISVS